MSWKETLAAVAPTLATVLGGPLAGAAVASIGKALLGDGNHSMGDIASAVANATPDQLLALKKVDADFEIKMKELDIKNTEGARDLAKETSIAPQVVLSIIYTIGYFGLMYAFVTGEVAINPDVKAEFNILLGALTAGQVQIMNFWFGSSSGSKEKTSKLKG